MILRPLLRPALHSAMRLPTARGGGVKLPRWQAAVLAAQAGTADALVAWVGDSTVTGVGAVVSAATDGARPFSAPKKLADALAGIVPASAMDIWGTQRRTTTAYSVYDTRVTGWTAITAALNAIIAGGYLRQTVAGTMTINFGETFNRLDLGMFNGVAGVFDVVTAGVTRGTITTTTGTYQSVTVPDGTTSVDFVWVSGDPRLFKIAPRNTATKRVYVGIIGQPGQTASSYTSTTGVGTTRTALANEAPALTIIDSAINEAAATEAEATYKAALQALIDVGKVTGDVVMVIPHITNGGAVSMVTYGNYIRDVATLNGLRTIDLQAVFGSFATANANGYMDTDGVHLTTTGYALKAQTVFNAIK